MPKPLWLLVAGGVAIALSASAGLSFLPNFHDPFQKEDGRRGLYRVKLHGLQAELIL